MIKELEEILCSDDVVKSINDNLDRLLDLIPEINDMIDFPHNHPHHHLDVWNHTLLALSMSVRQFDIRLVLLLHDIGKPHSYQDGEVRHFKNHPEVSSYMSSTILRRLGFDEKYIDYISNLVLKHDTEILDSDIEDNMEFAKKLFGVQYCDALAHNPLRLEKRKKYIYDTANRILVKDKTDDFCLKLINKLNEE